MKNGGLSCSTKCNNNNFRFDKRCPCTSDKGGGATLVRLCLARVFFMRFCVSARLQLHLQQPNMRRQIAPHLLSGGQQTVDSAGATLDFLVQLHLTQQSRSLSRRLTHLSGKHFATRLKFCGFLRSFAVTPSNSMTQQ